MTLSDALLKSGIEALENLADYAGKDEVEKARLVRVLEQKSDVLHAYEMGLDYGRNGANKINSHFGIFTTVESKDAWEKGRADSLKGDPHADSL